MNRRIAIEFLLTHPQADLDTISPLVERLRRKAIDLGFLGVSELVCLDNEADIITSDFGKRFLDSEAYTPLPLTVCSFTAALADSDKAEIGLGQFPTEIEMDGFVIPSGLPEWFWKGTVGTSDLGSLSKLLRYAAEIGIDSFMTFGGIELAWCRDDAGKVQVEQA